MTLRWCEIMTVPKIGALEPVSRENDSSVPSLSRCHASVFSWKCLFLLFNINIIFYAIYESLNWLTLHLKTFHSLIIKNQQDMKSYIPFFPYLSSGVHKETENKYDWPMFVFRVSSILFFKIIILFYLPWLVTESLVSKHTMFCQEEIMEERSMERNWVCQWRFYLQRFAICIFNLHNNWAVLLLWRQLFNNKKTHVGLRLWK